MAISSLLRKMAREEYSGIYKREMQVFAVGKWESSAGRMVTVGIGWNPSSEAGSAGDPAVHTTFSFGLHVKVRGKLKCFLTCPEVHKFLPL